MDDRVVVAASPALVSANFTVSVWVRTSNISSSTRSTIVAVGEDSTTDVMGWNLFERFGNFRFGYEPNSTSSPVWLDSGQFIADDAWHHLAATGSASGGIDLWVDGVLAASHASAQPIVASVQQELTMGCIRSVFGPAQPQPFESFFDGRIDEVTYWSRQLSAAEIASLSQAGMPSNTSGLVARWEFGEGAGQVASDSIGGHDGQLGSLPIADAEDPTWALFPFTVPATETVRLGSPANPNAFFGGASGGLVLGQTWDPRVDHSVFAPGAFVDVLALSLAPVNVPLPTLGTQLVDAGSMLLIGPVVPGTPFAFVLPPGCAFAGASLYSQAVSLVPGGLLLTNGLDLVVGTP